MIPDKKTHKATITNCLRFEISEEATKYDKPRYLEIGFDRGYTMHTLAEEFDTLVGLDNNPMRLSETTKLLKDCDNTELLLGTVESLGSDHWDVVLIDAAHDYTNVRNDFTHLLELNKADNYTIIFHDYGLIPMCGVKQFVNELFSPEEFQKCGEKDNYNPLGGAINDWEAAMVRMTPEFTERCLDRLSRV